MVDVTADRPTTATFAQAEHPPTALFVVGSLRVVGTTPCHMSVASCRFGSDRSGETMRRASTSRTTRGIRSAAVVFGLALFLSTGACSEPIGSSTSTEPAATSTTASASTSTSTEAPPVSTSTQPTSTTTTTEAAAPEEEIVQTWNAFWDAWSHVRNSQDLDPGALHAVAEGSVVEGVIALFERQHQTSGPIATEVTSHPKVTVEGSEAVIEDCVLIRPSFTETVGVWYEADLQKGEDGWRVTDLDIRSSQGCVPAALASAGINGYEAYYEAREEFWDPPEPTHPLLDDVLTDPQLSFVRELLEEYEVRGAALRGRPKTHAEVVEVRGPAELVILSCIEPNPDYGLFDLETGERLPDEPAVKSGQRDLESAVMRFEDGAWKVADLQGQVDQECEFAPTERGLPSV